MSSEASRAGKRLLVYDGECPLCIGFSALYVRLGWIPAEQRVPLLDLEPEVIERLLALGFGNEMAVVEPDREIILTGVEGILHVMRHTWARPLATVLGWPGLRQLTELAYRFIGANRRFLSLPRPKGPTCACEPDEKPLYNLALVALALGLGALVAAPFEGLGASVRGIPGELVVLPVVLATWWTIAPGLRLRALGHVSMSTLHAGIVLGLGSLLGDKGLAWGLTWALAVLWCGRQLVRRLRYLDADHVGLRTFFLALGIVALLGEL